MNSLESNVSCWAQWLLETEAELRTLFLHLKPAVQSINNRQTISTSSAGGVHRLQQTTGKGRIRPCMRKQMYGFDQMRANRNITKLTIWIAQLNGTFIMMCCFVVPWMLNNQRNTLFNCSNLNKTCEFL